MAFCATFILCALHTFGLNWLLVPLQLKLYNAGFFFSNRFMTSDYLSNYVLQCKHLKKSSKSQGQSNDLAHFFNQENWPQYRLFLHADFFPPHSLDQAGS